jgi:condensin complex subunit 3
VALLTRLLDDGEVDIRTKITEGLCKLFMTGAINSPRLLQRLLLIWYNPLTENDEQLRHILGTFFPLYSSMSRENQVSDHVDA